MREIRLPGSEGGAILISRPYPYATRPTSNGLRRLLFFRNSEIPRYLIRV